MRSVVFDWLRLFPMPLPVVEILPLLSSNPCAIASTWAFSPVLSLSIPFSRTLSMTQPAENAVQLALRGVTKSFNGGVGQVTALEGIDLNVRQGEFVCLVGPSGCGKSTLLSLIAGLEQADAGSMLLDGEPVRTPGRDRMVMFQQDALFPWLNVLDNVLFGLRLKSNLTEGECLEVARYYLDLVGLADRELARPHELSGGMRQRVALARCLAPNPRVLLMDEPFSSLDALTRDQLYGDIQRIFTQRRKTIVLVTHNIREAVCLGDRVVLLSPNPGRVRQVFDINLPRPRRINDPALANLAAEVTAALAAHLATSESVA
jgi:NitT/TauT family transport system ATP-binding protein